MWFKREAQKGETLKRGGKAVADHSWNPGECGFKIKRKEDVSGRREWSAISIASRRDKHPMPLTLVRAVLIFFEQCQGSSVAISQKAVGWGATKSWETPENEEWKELLKCLAPQEEGVYGGC